MGAWNAATKVLLLEKLHSGIQARLTKAKVIPEQFSGCYDKRMNEFSWRGKDGQMKGPQKKLGAEGRATGRMFVVEWMEKCEICGRKMEDGRKQRVREVHWKAIPFELILVFVNNSVFHCCSLDVSYANSTTEDCKRFLMQYQTLWLQYANSMMELVYNRELLKLCANALSECRCSPHN